MPEAVANRVVRFRLLPETPGRASMLAQLAGANRFVWNAALARNEELFRARNQALKAAGWDGETKTRKNFDKLADPAEFPKPDTHKFGLIKWFSAFRPGVAWLNDLPSHAVRATLKDMANAYKDAFADPQRGFPKFKSRNKKGRRADGFWIDEPSLKDGAILIPRAQTPKGEPNRPPVRMKLRRRGKSPYDGLRVKRARVVLDGKKWFVFLWYEVPAEVCESPVRNREVIGVDLNTARHGAALSAPIVLPDGEVADKSVLPKKLEALEKRRRRYQRMMSRKVDAALRAVGWNGRAKNRRAYEGILKKKHREEKARRREAGGKLSKRAIRYGESQYGIRHAIAAGRAAKAAAAQRGIRGDWAHQTARALARTAEVVGLEDLKTKNLTRSAKGDAENPGKNVRQKAGLNRAILGAGWGALQRALEYKCGEVKTINPANTTRRCHACGEVNETLTLDIRTWKCPKCGAAHDRDGNAAKNIAKIACAGAETPDAILARGHGAAARGGRPPPPNRRNSAANRREVRSPPSFLDGPERAKREQ